MNIIAVDDEQLLLYELLNELEKVFPDADLIGFDEGEDALEHIEKMKGHLDYAFLDIKLRGMTGIQLAKQIKDRKQKTRDQDHILYGIFRLCPGSISGACSRIYYEAGHSR